MGENFLFGENVSRFPSFDLTLHRDARVVQHLPEEKLIPDSASILPKPNKPQKHFSRKEPKHVN
jgi:hypothetical protein